MEIDAKAIEKLELKPGDKLVLSIDAVLTKEQERQIKRGVDLWSGGVPCLVVPKGAKLSVLRNEADTTGLDSKWREYHPANKVEFKTETLEVAQVNAVAGNLEIVSTAPLFHKILLDGKEVEHCTDLTLSMKAGELAKLTMTTALIKGADEPKEEPKESWRDKPPLV